MNNKSLTYKLGLAAFASFAFTGINSAHAVLNPTSPAHGYNIFVSSDLTFNSLHVDGAVATGGNLILNGQTNIGQHTTGSYPFALGNAHNYSVYVNGLVTYPGNGVSQVNGDIKIVNMSGSLALDHDNATIPNHQHLQVVSSTGSGYDSQPRLQNNADQDQTGTNAYPVSGTGAFGAGDVYKLNFTTAFNTLNTNASSMANYATTCSSLPTIATISIPSGSNPVVPMQANKTNVINMTKTQFLALSSPGSGQGTITFGQNGFAKPSATSPLVFNITDPAGAYTINWTPFNAGGLSDSEKPYIIYNFYQATAVTINTGSETYGTIFAPQAAVTRPGSNNLNGQVIGATFKVEGGEVHEWPFVGALPDCAGTPLAITLEAFTGEKASDGHALLHWSTAEETNASHFEIVKSSNGIDFESVGSIAANNVSNSHYTFEDPSNLSAGNNYYRLNMYSDGKMKVSSQIVTIAGDAFHATSSSLFPIPASASTGLTVKTTHSSASTGAIRVLSSTGQTVKQIAVEFTEGSQNISVDTSGLAPGMYLITIQSNEGSETLRALIQ